jgi:hypothetical protein
MCPLLARQKMVPRKPLVQVLQRSNRKTPTTRHGTTRELNDEQNDRAESLWFLRSSSDGRARRENQLFLLFDVNCYGVLL